MGEPHGGKPGGQKMKKMNQANEINSTIQDAEHLGVDFEGLPERVTLRVVRQKRTGFRGGLPIEELERISVMRLWAPLAGIPRHPQYPDDFEPALPAQGLIGRTGE